MKKITVLFTLFCIITMRASLAQSTSPLPYCAADFDDQSGFLVADAINSVSFGTLSNPSNAQFAYPHYVFYNSLPVPNFQKGSSYPITVIFDVHGGAGYGVWIDYNQNNIFESSEKVCGTNSSTNLSITSTTTINQNISIPSTALSGNTRMRVRIVEDDLYTMSTNGYSIAPCNASATALDIMDWGETEDYTINITTSTALNETFNNAQIILFPNPANTFLTLKTVDNSNLKYKIFSATGHEMQCGTFSNVDKQISIATLASGVYSIQLFDNEKLVAVKKLIKTNN